MDLKEKCHFGRIDIPNRFMDLKKKKCQFFGRIDRIFFFVRNRDVFFFASQEKKFAAKKRVFLHRERWITRCGRNRAIAPRSARASRTFSNSFSMVPFSQWAPTMWVWISSPQFGHTCANARRVRRGAGVRFRTAPLILPEKRWGLL
jgi:hypothetical protein